MSVPARKAAVRYLLEHYCVSHRRACALLKLPRKTFYYQSKRPPQDALRRRIVELAKTRVRYGYKRIHVLLQREGIHVNHKRVHRLYCLEGLQLRSKRPHRRVSAANRHPPRIAAKSPDDAWSMDFVSDQLSDGTRFRALTVIDIYTRECISIDPGTYLRAEDVVRILQKAATTRAFQIEYIAGRLLDLWAYTNKVVLEFSRPGKPTDNAYIESFNGSLRDECLNCHWFDSLTEARSTLQAWQEDYNENRPHRALNDLSPREFATHWAKQSQKFAVEMG